MTTVVSSYQQVSAADPPHRLAFGAFPQPQGGQSQRQATEQLEAQIGRKLEVVRVFKTWSASFPDSFDNWLKSGDRTLIMSVKPTSSNGTRITWPALATAAPGSTLDTQMRTWARKVRDFQAPIYITLHHEPESAGTSPGTSADFIAAWRHWVDIFREEGATNARYMFIMTDYAFEVPSTDRRSGPKWFPGEAWVDAMAIDAYNWHVCRPNADNAWRTLANIVEPFRQFGLLHPTIDLWLTEWGTWEDPAVANRKAQWIDQARALFAQPAYSQFAGVAYFDSDAINPDFPDCLWLVDTSPSSLASFAAMANDPLYSGDAFGEPDPPPDPVAPTAAFSSTCADLVCTFTDGSTDPDGPIVSRLWDYGDGNTSTETSPVHTYGAEGPYTVTLTVTDEDTMTGTVSHDIIVVIAPPAAPVAAFTTACIDLVCTFTDGSTDSDGSIVSRLWDFGDGNTSAETSPVHSYGAEGQYTVTLTVTDDETMTGSVFHDIDVVVVPPLVGPGFRAANSANSSGTAASVAIPGSVVIGDRLVLIITANNATTATTPAGWTLLGTQSDGTPDMRSWVFTRVAVANTPGSTVVSTLGVSSRSSRIVLAYSDAGVPSVTSAVQGPSSTSHSTPAATVAVGSRVVAYWSDETNNATGWTLPAAVESRATSIGTSTGHINAAAGDALAANTAWPAATAVSTAASAKAIMWTVVVPIAGPNQNPTAAFTSSCTALVCSFSSATSTDVDGAVVDATWTFGDTTGGTGLTTSHTYADAGTYPVTVTVTDDDGGTASITQDVTASLPSANPITFVAQATANANATSHRVVIPASVQAGDGLILAFTANTGATVGTPTGITGWRLLGTQSNGSMSTRIWTRVASAGNAGTGINLTTSTISKGNFVVAAYRGTSSIDAVTTVASALETTSRTTHTTPSVQVASDRAWVVWYWAHKDNTTATLTVPAGATARSNSSQTGSGRVTGLLADSNGAIGIGTAAGKTATAAAANSNATMWAIVLAPA